MFVPEGVFKKLQPWVALCSVTHCSPQHRGLGQLTLQSFPTPNPYEMGHTRCATLLGTQRRLRLPPVWLRALGTE